MLPFTMPLRLASALPIINHLVPAFAQPAPIFDEEDARLLDKPLGLLHAFFDTTIGLAVAGLWLVGGWLSERPSRR